MDYLILTHILTSRYTDEYTIQPMITPGKNAPVNMESYLSIVVDKICDLSQHGMMVRKDGREVASCRVHSILCSGNLVGMITLKTHLNE